jgi:hypothetical protein
MSYYMLNLVFNFSDATALNGRFLDFDSSQENPFLTSKAWLQPVVGAPNPPDPNVQADWTYVDRDNQHITIPLNPPSSLWVRVADFNQPQDNYNARVTTLMARNDQKNPKQQMSSPIQDENHITGPVCIWDTPKVGGVAPASGTNPGWVTYLGSATVGSGVRGNVDNYLFLVAAVVQGVVQGVSVTRAFCHDPDLDISC